MVKHTQTIRRQIAEELSVFDYFVGLALKGLKYRIILKTKKHKKRIKGLPPPQIRRFLLCSLLEGNAVTGSISAKVNEIGSCAVWSLLYTMTPFSTKCVVSYLLLY